jgi:hypothetical protein
MLVCNVSLLRRRAAIAADVTEAAAAADAPGTGNVVFATLVDDPASVRDTLDAYLGEIMVEVPPPMGGARDSVNAGLVYRVTVVEGTTAADLSSASVPVPLSAAVAETVTAASTQDATTTSVSHTTFNPADLLNVTLSGGNLTATGTGQGGVRTITSISSGKYYWEFTLGTISNANTGVGFGTAAANLANCGPTPVRVVLMYNNGDIYIDNGGTVYHLGARSAGDVIGVAVDVTAQLVWFRVAPSGNWNSSGTANPATGTGGISINTVNLSAALFPLVAPGASGNGATGNFGASSFTGSVPSGFAAGL